MITIASAIQMNKKQDSNAQEELLTRIDLIFQHHPPHQMEVRKSLQRSQTRQTIGPSFFEFGMCVGTDGESYNVEVWSMGREHSMSGVFLCITDETAALTISGNISISRAVWRRWQPSFLWRPEEQRTAVRQKRCCRCEDGWSLEGGWCAA
jgi:hypothetical protein